MLIMEKNCSLLVKSGLLYCLSDKLIFCWQLRFFKQGFKWINVRFIVALWLSSAELMIYWVCCHLSCFRCLSALLQTSSSQELLTSLLFCLVCEYLRQSSTNSYSNYDESLILAAADSVNNFVFFLQVAILWMAYIWNCSLNRFQLCFVGTYSRLLSSLLKSWFIDSYQSGESFWFLGDHTSNDSHSETDSVF